MLLFFNHCICPFLFSGVFITKGDVGVGTIVGSAVFNILFVIGICGIFAG
jgi:Ca2+/Na+ antiporter